MNLAFSFAAQNRLISDVPPSLIQLGSLTQVVRHGAKWRRELLFPYSQASACEAERIFEFLSVQGQFERFLPRLRDDARALQAAIAEGRVAFFHFRNGFDIHEWEPPGRDRCVGEFSVSWNWGQKVFVEVKAPDWQGQLSKDELLSDRKQKGKWVDGEGGCVSPFPERTIKNAVLKLRDDQPNLVVIAGDLFISPAEVPDSDLKDRVDEFFRRPENRVLGGLLFFKADECRNEIEYKIRFYANPYACAPCRIPADIAAGLAASSQADEARRPQRGRSPVARFFQRNL